MLFVNILTGNFRCWFSFSGKKIMLIAAFLPGDEIFLM